MISEVLQFSNILSIRGLKCLNPPEDGHDTYNKYNNTIIHT